MRRMSAINVPLNSFNGGEIGKEAQARVDLDLYPACADVMENVLPLMQGPMIKAPGTEYIARSLYDMNAIVRPFIFSVDQTRVLHFMDSLVAFIDGNAVSTLVGAAATIGSVADNGSGGASSIVTAGNNVTFICGASGEAAAYWPITAGEPGKEVSFRFQVDRRPISIRVGTTPTLADIQLPGGVYELILDPGIHIISFTPNVAAYYIRARLTTPGKASMRGLTRLGANELYLPTPWLEADLPSLRFRQSLDAYWLYHPNYRTRVLERRSNTSWSLRYFRPQDGPFETPNTSNVTMYPSALSGNATITSSLPMFDAGFIGQIIELTHQGQTVTDAFDGVDQTSDTIRIFGVETARAFGVQISGTFTATITLQRSVNEVDWTNADDYTGATDESVTDGLDNQIIYYRLKCTAYTSGTANVALTYAAGETTGRAEIVAFNSPTSVEIEISEAFGKTGYTTQWSLGAWSDNYGWPAAGALDNGCHCLVRDDRFWKSVSDDYESFLIGVDAADAMARRFGTGEMNSARWIESAKRILVGTSGAELEVSSNALDEPITPTNSRLRGFDDNGSADTQSVKANGNRVLFVDRTRAKLLQCLYDGDVSTDQHDTDDLTRLHNEIAGIIDEEAGTGGFVEIAFQRKPEPRVWCVRDDGELAVLLFGPREGVYAWSRYKAANGGLFKSVCVVPGRPEDRVHFIVQRPIGGSMRTYHERLALQRFPIETDDDGVRTAPDAWRLQSALYSSSETPASVFTGLDHLEGETVSVWADGRVHPTRVVSGGSITLNADYNTVIIGLNYTGKWRSAKMAYGAQAGTALTQDKEMSRLGVIVHDTADGAIKYGRSFEAATDVLVRESDDGAFVMDAPVTLWSAEHNQPFEGASDVDARVCLVMDTPAPATVLALVPAMELHERS